MYKTKNELPGSKAHAKEARHAKRMADAVASGSASVKAVEDCTTIGDAVRAGVASIDVRKPNVHELGQRVMDAAEREGDVIVYTNYQYQKEGAELLKAQFNNGANFFWGIGYENRKEVINVTEARRVALDKLNPLDRLILGL